MNARRSATQVEYHDLPPEFHHWKWRILIAFCVFYAFNYLGRFNFSLVQYAVIQDLGITRVDTGWINSWMFWGFAFGDLVFGRIAEKIGYKNTILFAAITTSLFNFIASFGNSISTLAIPWAVVGFVNAATWGPGLGLVAQWWPRRERGQAIGLVGTAAGIALLIVWAVVPWTAAQYGWRVAIRYPPLIIAVLGIIFYFIAKDKPAELNLPEYIESDDVSREAEAAGSESEHGLKAYFHLMTNLRFFLACHVKGLDNVVRYGVVSWAPLYYAQVGGFNLKEMGLLTFAYPLGYLFGPIFGGIISDRFFKSNRSIVIILAAFLSAAAMMGIAYAPADNIPLAVILLIVGGFCVNMSTVQALGVDLAGRRLAGTAAGVLDAHGYIYGALQAIFFGWLSLAISNGWFWVFAAMAASRLIAVLLVWRVRA